MKDKHIYITGYQAKLLIDLLDIQIKRYQLLDNGKNIFQEEMKACYDITKEIEKAV